MFDAKSSQKQKKSKMPKETKVKSNTYQKLYKKTEVYKKKAKNLVKENEELKRSLKKKEEEIVISLRRDALRFFRDPTKEAIICCYCDEPCQFCDLGRGDSGSDSE